MASGRLIDLDNFTENDVDLDDIAHHLAKIQRFNGGTPLDVSYTVGEHSINLVQYAKNDIGISKLGLKMLLLHDASEAYLSDIVSPAKKHMPDYVELEKMVQHVINKKLIGISFLVDDIDTLKTLDKEILIDEVEHVKPELLHLYKHETGLEGLECHVHYNNHPATTKRCFLTLAKTLGVLCSS